LYNSPVPPRYAYWTILIDQRPTAFRAKSQEDLLPTLHQLRRTNSDVVMKWFARGRLWDSPEAERAAQRKPRVTEVRGRDWRPGGQHKDPRERFKKPSRKERDPRAWRRPEQDFRSSDPGAVEPRGDRPARHKRAGPAPDRFRSQRPGRNRRR
jgi:hypothetical protein